MNESVIYVSIGNSDDKLIQSRWSSFVVTTRDSIRRHANRIIGEWYSAPDAGYQNACFAFTTENDHLATLLQTNLSAIAAAYNQESIAWAHCPKTEFLSND